MTETWREKIHYSQGNPFHLLGKSNRAIGGNFFVEKQEVFHTGPPVRDYSGTSNPYEPNSFHWRGPVHAINAQTSGFPSITMMSSDSQLDVIGTKIIANVLPTNPLSGLFVALGELKSEGIPSLSGVASWKNRTRVARSAGDEYLGIQFGWLPLVSELKSFTHSVKNSDELIAQYARNSGRRIKRHVNLPVTVETSTTLVEDKFPHPSYASIYFDPSCKRHTQSRIIREQWFNAAFSYYLPPYNPNGDNTKRNEQLANYLYGTRVTPEGIWDLTPWTWAADWVGNFGDVLHNVSAFRNDGLVMHYGYVMEQLIHEKVVTYPALECRSYPGSKVSLSTTLRSIVKRRRTATPYGFGLNPNSFSDRQWSILAALGLSKGSRKLFD